MGEMFPGRGPLFCVIDASNASNVVGIKYKTGKPAPSEVRDAIELSIKIV